MVEVLTDDALASIFSLLSALELRPAACCSRRWRDAIPRHHTQLCCLVTSAGSNEVVLFDARGRIAAVFKALPPPKRRHGRGGGASSWRGHDWPTCLALGPRGELYVSQYRVQGLLQFDRSPDGFRYRRTLASGARYASPEGVVCAHGCVYLACVERGVIARLSPRGELLGESAAFEAHGEFYVYWGMALGPDGSLYIAAHVSEGGDFLSPTPTDTGGVRRSPALASDYALALSHLRAWGCRHASATPRPPRPLAPELSLLPTFATSPLRCCARGYAVTEPSTARLKPLRGTPSPTADATGRATPPSAATALSTSPPFTAPPRPLTPLVPLTRGESTSLSRQTRLSAPATPQAFQPRPPRPRSRGPSRRISSGGSSRARALTCCAARGVWPLAPAARSSSAASLQRKARRRRRWYAFRDAAVPPRP